MVQQDPSRTSAVCRSGLRGAGPLFNLLGVRVFELHNRVSLVRRALLNRDPVATWNNLTPCLCLSHTRREGAAETPTAGGGRRAGKRCRNSGAASFVQRLQCYKTSAQHSESALSCVKSQNIGNLLRLHTHVVAVTSRSSL